MNTHKKLQTQETAVTPVAYTTTHTDDKKKYYKKSVIELYQEAVEKTSDKQKIRTQISSSGNEFSGLNKAILSQAQDELALNSNKWFSKKAMQDNNLVAISEDDYGVILFLSKLKDIEGSARQEKIITYYRVFNEDSLVPLPL